MTLVKPTPIRNRIYRESEGKLTLVAEDRNMKILDQATFTAYSSKPDTEPSSYHGCRSWLPI